PLPGSQVTGQPRSVQLREKTTTSSSEGRQTKTPRLRKACAQSSRGTSIVARVTRPGANSLIGPTFAHVPRGRETESGAKIVTATGNTIAAVTVAPPTLTARA